MCQYLMMLGRSMQMDLEELMLSQEDSHVSRGALLEKERAILIHKTVISGLRWLPLLKSYSLNGSLAKMSKALLTNQWASLGHSLTWKVLDTNRHIGFYLRLGSERHTGEIGSSFWRTPDTGAGGTSGLLKKGNTHRENGQPIQIRLVDQVNNPYLWPTPTAHLAKETNAPSEANRNEPTIASLVGGQLNPIFVEWLMGYPEGWTDLDV
tara:strand:- start:62 stop:688 length:627 start_codon:yes stop_codon:yes gene_type:complete